MPVERAAGMLRDAAPDLILFPGDIFSAALTDSVRDCFNENGFRLLSLAARIAPCFFSPGNHEMGMSGENRRLLEEIGVTVLDNEFVRAGDLLVGGCSSAYMKPKSMYDKAPVPDLGFLPSFAREDGYHVLLCHHPEYWLPFVAGHGIELTAAGHAHGGQWRFFGRGVWSPGQGLFPAYADGLYREGDEFLAVSRGMTNSVRFVPRFFNPCEILLLELGPETDPAAEGEAVK